MNEEVSWRERYRVRLGAVAGAILIWRAQPTHPVFLAFGILLAFCGLLLRQWAAGCIHKNQSLTTEGPYAIVRNPLYLGSLLMGAGFLLSATSFRSAFDLRRGYLDRTLLFWAVLWIFLDSIYLPKIRKEESILEEKFGQEFRDYAQKVPALVPKLSGLRKPDLKCFSIEQWKKNDELGSLIGFILICAILIARYRYAR